MIRVDLQNELGFDEIPSLQMFECWVKAALQQDYPALEQSVRIVDETESRRLNRNFRGIDKPTNVLSFPSEDTTFLDYAYLGDLVICAPVVRREALEQGKDLVSHWVHMVLHGMLHLQGFDHGTESEAQKMEALEIEILATLGHTNPYQ